MVFLVMPANAGIHDFGLARKQDVDGRHFRHGDGASRLSAGHDESEYADADVPARPGNDESVREDGAFTWP